MPLLRGELSMWWKSKGELTLLWPSLLLTMLFMWLSDVYSSSPLSISAAAFKVYFLYGYFADDSSSFSKPPPAVPSLCIMLSLGLAHSLFKYYHITLESYLYLMSFVATFSPQPCHTFVSVSIWCLTRCFTRGWCPLYWLRWLFSWPS